MRKLNINFAIFLLSLGLSSIVQAQNTLTLIIQDEDSGEPLIGANCVLKGTSIGASADKDGKIIIPNIPNGEQEFIISYVGYEKVEKEFYFPLKYATPIIVLLENKADLEGVIVYSTRTANRIEEIPTRVEVLGNEEVVEETAINPGNISKLLSETSGIQVQHSSAISGNVSFRMQGLPGKYTQLLHDGFPVYSGFSSGLSLLQIPPLDLQQVEIVKGSASTLYGADAIAGIVNLISKNPKDKPELSALINQTHLGGRDISTYYSATNNKLGITLLASVNTQKAQDVSNNKYTDLPQYNRAVVVPKIFYDFNENNHLTVGINSVIEDRVGGDVMAINHEQDSIRTFFEENKTKRINGSVKYENIGKTDDIFTVKVSYGNFNRGLTTNTNFFGGFQNTVYTELSYLVTSEDHQWVSGLNYYLDDFRQKQPIDYSLSYNYQTIGLFSQDNWEITNKFYLEPGIRFDYNFKYGVYFLPRLAAMYHITDNFFTRLSGGMGYKLPTPFTDDAERTRYQKVIMPKELEVEKSAGLNLDFNYKTPLFDEFVLTINQAFFITQIKNPIIANVDSLQNQIVYNENAGGAIFSKGLNTNIKLAYDELVLYVDYVYLEAQKTYDNNKQLELTPHNRLTTTLAYENEAEGWKIGLEAFYYGSQFREEGGPTPDYWLLGASTQKTIGHFTVALNVENILDVRQTRYENIVSGPINNPNFKELYAPLDGIVGNIVLKFDLY